MNRRVLLLGGLAASTISLTSADVRAAEAICKTEPVAKPITRRPDNAVSLRRLFASLEPGKPKSVGGLTRLDGYIWEPVTSDIIVWGPIDAGQPEVQADDLILAMRSARGLYDEIRGDTRYVKRPLISIDPDHEALKRIESIDLADPARKEKFAEICKYPQTVRVEGMERNSRIAKVLIDADYRMKQVGQGTARLPINSPFDVPFAVQVRKWRERVKNGGGGAAARSTRFWFEPGNLGFVSDGRTIFLDYAQVVLRDEDQRPDTNEASGSIDEISRAFACAWTARMDDIYGAEPIWRDMQGIFRLIALARVMEEEDALPRATQIRQLIRERKSVEFNVPTTLPGLGRWVETDSVTKRKGYREKSRYSYNVCGGVSVGFTREMILKAKRSVPPEVAKLWNDIVNSRPDVNAITWAIVPGAIKVPQTQSTPEIAKSAAPPAALTVPASWGGWNRRDLDVLWILGLGGAATLFGMGLRYVFSSVTGGRAPQPQTAAVSPNAGGVYSLPRQLSVAGEGATRPPAGQAWQPQLDKTPPNAGGGLAHFQPFSLEGEGTPQTISPQQPQPAVLSASASDGSEYPPPLSVDGESAAHGATLLHNHSQGVRRNGPCPCGSGKRFKHCHGILT
jgi:hypothetical protein